jgi:hypothetical protein
LLALALELLRLRAGEAVRCGVCGRDDGLDDEDGVPRPFEDERLEARGMAFDEDEEDETEAEAGRGLPALEGREELPTAAATVDFSPRRLPLWVVAGVLDADTAREADDDRGWLAAAEVAVAEAEAGCLEAAAAVVGVAVEADEGRAEADWDWDCVCDCG